MFQLKDYLPEILAIAEKGGCTKTAAVDRFILNLTTFNEYNEGTHTINYHILGHQWGDLPSAQKVEQKREAKRLIVEEAPVTSRKNRRR